jgi:Fic family protein
MNLTQLLQEEKTAKRKGGLYHKTQVSLTYNSNKIEGSRLTEEQTRYIFETRTIGFQDQAAVPVDDIIEASNHFVAFDYLLGSMAEPLTNDLIKKFHGILKASTADAAQDWFAVGDWKKSPNEVGGPKLLCLKMLRLTWRNSISGIMRRHK